MPAPFRRSDISWPLDEMQLSVRHTCAEVLRNGNGGNADEEIAQKLNPTNYQYYHISLYAQNVCVVSKRDLNYIFMRIIPFDVQLTNLGRPSERIISQSSIELKFIDFNRKRATCCSGKLFGLI